MPSGKQILLSVLQEISQHNHKNNESGVVKQGLGISKPNVFLSDLFSELMEDDVLPERIKKRFPELTQEEYSGGLDIIWFLLSAFQYWEELKGVENEGVLDKKESERLLKASSRQLKLFGEDILNGIQNRENI
ncbi:MAG: hypothetical protein DRQ49_02180 [Gammaproteobacteria bacterium]|nr:MAG: hypothetical protein DRQ49_02180 [Gammaproteobacteria bacterium]RKZ77242.1 MAG: hypothetical protein DRQ57_00710 [Gammaproteobacteria bacterium]